MYKGIPIFECINVLLEVLVSSRTDFFVFELTRNVIKSHTKMCSRMMANSILSNIDPRVKIK